MSIFHVIRSIWIWSASTILVLLWIPLLGVIRVFDRDPIRFRTGRWFRLLGRNLARVNPWRLHIRGGEKIRPGQAYAVVCNHQSLADIPVICFLKMDTKWLAKADLFRFPLTGPMMRMAGDIPVYRGERRKGGKALLQAANYVRGGCSVVFFPEGTRSRDGEIGTFSDGPFQLAVREQVPVLPLVIEGSGEALPRHSWLFGDSLDIDLEVLDPVFPGQSGLNDPAALRDAVRRMMIDELHQIRSRPT